MLEPRKYCPLEQTSESESDVKTLDGVEIQPCETKLTA